MIQADWCDGKKKESTTINCWVLIVLPTDAQLRAHKDKANNFKMITSGSCKNNKTNPCLTGGLLHFT